MIDKKLQCNKIGLQTNKTIIVECEYVGIETFEELYENLGEMLINKQHAENI